MRGWKKATVIIVVGIFLILSTLGVSACKEEVKSIWSPKEPTEYQLSLLERVYNDLYSFNYVEDELELEWKGPLKQRFDQLCGEKVNITIRVDAEDYQLPEETLMTKGGDCTDFANLFVSAARSIGVSARVAIGKVKFEEELNYHSWCEVYYQGEWREINPRGKINEDRVSFAQQLKGLISLRIYEIHCRYDERIFEGSPLIKIPEADKETNKIDFFNGLTKTFKQVKGREPTEEEIIEFKEMAEDVANQAWREIIKYIPENPHSLIQPNHSRIKAWIRESGKG